MGDMWGMCTYESVQGAVTSTAQVKGLLASRSREESKQRGSSQFKVTCHQQRGSWVLGARMERDSQAHLHPEQSESARELRILGTKSSKEKPALRERSPLPRLTRASVLPLRSQGSLAGPRSEEADLGS